MGKKKIEKIKMKKFESGGKRSDDTGKGCFSLLMVHGLLRVSKLAEKGGKIYGRHNFARGLPQSRYYDALGRHFLKELGGASDEDHLAAIAWNALALMEQQELIKRGLLDPKFNDHRVLLDEKGKQCIPKCVFWPDEFLDKKSKNAKRNNK